MRAPLAVLSTAARPRTAATLAGLCAAGLLVAACSADGSGVTGAPAGLGTQTPEPQPTTREAILEPVKPSKRPDPRAVRVVASGLSVPWGVTFLPDQTALVSERDTATIRAIDPRGGPQSIRTVGNLDEVSPEGEGGLLGLAVSPSYDEDRLVFAYTSTAEDNRVVKMTYDGKALGAPEPVLTGIPNGRIHDGGGLLFAPDGTLFVSTGEIGEPALAQDPASLAGKVLHITTDGEPASDNPVDGSDVWSMGHRNIQGLAFDDAGRLWSTEFGQNTFDELNLIQRGRNYGWPLVEGKGDLEEYRNPFVQWRTEDASPSGLAYTNGSLWAGALRGQRLWEIPVTQDGVGQPRGWFVGDYGRIRSVQVAPNGNLWITTSNRDGRGDPVAADDRIIEVAVS